MAEPALSEQERRILREMIEEYRWWKRTRRMALAVLAPTMLGMQAIALYYQARGR